MAIGSNVIVSASLSQAGDAVGANKIENKIEKDFDRLFAQDEGSPRERLLTIARRLLARYSGRDVYSGPTSLIHDAVDKLLKKHPDLMTWPLDRLLSFLAMRMRSQLLERIARLIREREGKKSIRAGYLPTPRSQKEQDTMALRKERLDVALKYLETQNPTAHSVFLLKKQFEYSTAEIAVMKNLTIPGVRRIVEQANEILKREIDRD